MNRRKIRSIFVTNKDLWAAQSAASVNQTKQRTVAKLALSTVKGRSGSNRESDQIQSKQTKKFLSVKKEHSNWQTVTETEKIDNKKGERWFLVVLVLHGPGQSIKECQKDFTEQEEKKGRKGRRIIRCVFTWIYRHYAPIVYSMAEKTTQNAYHVSRCSHRTKLFPIEMNTISIFGKGSEPTQ